MSNTLNAYDALVRAAAHNGRLEAMTEVLAIVSVIADGDKATCLRIIRAIAAHQERVISWSCSGSSNREGKAMKESEILYAAAESMRKGEFSLVLRDGPNCGCFIFHMLGGPLQDGQATPEQEAAFDRISDIVGGVSEWALLANHWSAADKDDAIAALTIAADCAFEDEKAQ